jgi:hypothetical protein
VRRARCQTGPAYQWHRRPTLCRGPPVSPSSSPPFGWQRAHGARRARPPDSGRCRPGAAHRSVGTPHCLWPASSMHQPPFLSNALTLSTPQQTSSPSVHPTLGAPIFPARIPAAAPPSFTRSVSRRPSRFPVNLDPTSPHSLSPRGAELGPRRR